jgi:hypothetical protein
MTAMLERVSGWVGPIAMAVMVVLTCQAPLNAQRPAYAAEPLEGGKGDLVHPLEVRVIQTDYRQQSVRPERLLRLTMRTVSVDAHGGRLRHLFFSAAHVSAYVEAIDQFVRMSREAFPPQESRIIARVPAWESFQVKRDVVFSYQPPGDEQGDQPVLLIALAYDVERRGGAFLFSPANADQLLHLLFDFLKDG